ncbi:hypothetical protein CK203_017680 [Vitis vinifera]|uniref:Uncharacterized protein n=1 Tax=Vitis vinifera TaxID=29760 RepID=A0A438JH14_VITVI|nr:hypothetical protein CK203_017680 [Vitis vinifera]
MEEAKTMKTPMSSSIKLDKDEKGKSIDSTMYRGMIGLVDWFVGAGILKSLPCFIFSTVLLHFFKVLHISASNDQFGQDIGPIAGLGVDFGTIKG